MDTHERREVLVVEDDEGWQFIFEEEGKREKWRTHIIDTIPRALHFIESGDIQLDIVIADKGGSNAQRGGVDLIGHRDGLTILRRVKELQPHCIRILSTGEYWSEELFADSTLGLHIFVEKGNFSDNIKEILQILRSWSTAPTLDHPLVFE